MGFFAQVRTRRLLRRMASGDPVDRVNAGKALVVMGRRALPTLLMALGDPAMRMKAAAAMALGQIGAPDAAGPLTSTLNCRDSHVRRCAAAALGRIADARALGPLLDTLQGDDDPSVRAEAAWALGALKDRRAVLPLIAALRWGSLTVRRNSAWALGEIGDPRAVNGLTALQPPQSPALAGTVREALRKIRQGGSTPDASNPQGLRPAGEDRPMDAVVA